MLAQASELLGEAHDPRRVLDAIARLLVPRLGDHCVIDAVDDEGQLVRVAEASVDEETEALLRRLRAFDPNPSHPTPAWEVLRTGRPQVIEPFDRRAVERFAEEPEHRAILTELRLTSSISVPATARGRVLAVVTFGMGGSGRVHAPEDVEFAERLARQAALALDTQRLYEAERRARGEAERTAWRLARLERLASTLSTTVTSTEVAQAVLEHGIPALGAAAGCVGVLDEQREALEMLAFRGFPPEVEHGWTRIPLDLRIPLTAAVLTGKPLLVEDRHHWHQGPSFSCSTSSGGGVVAVLPLAAQATVLGAVSFTLDRQRAATDADRPLMATLADQCALALDRAHLYAAERRATEAERSARSEAKRAGAARDELLSLVSHELRAPLGTVRLAATVLTERVPADDAHRDQVDTILRATAALDRRLENLVDLARLEGDGLELSRQPEGVAPLLADVVARRRAQAASRGQHLELRTGDPEARVLCDRRRVTQVLVHLVDNALQFAPAGGRVLLGAHPVPGAVELRVRDSGPGLSEEARRRMFDRFWRQAPPGGADAPGACEGLGLGLTLVRGLVEAHGSHVEVESAPSWGTEIRFRLPTPLD